MSANMIDPDKDLIEPAQHVETLGHGVGNEHITEGKGLSDVHAVNANERVMTYWEGITRYKVALACSLFISFGSLLNGLDGTLQGSVLSVPTFRAYFGNEINGEYVIPANWQSWWNGLSKLGSMLGGLTTGFLADYVGRKNTLYFGCVLSIATVFMMFFIKPHAYLQMLFGRFLNGWASGIFDAIAVSFACEMSPLPIRGLTTGGANLWIVAGQLLGNGIIAAVGARGDNSAWKIPTAVQWIVPGVLIIGMPFVPESAWWLVSKGKHAEAKKALHRLYRGSGDDIDQHYERVREIVELERHLHDEVSYFDLFKGTNSLRTWTVAAIQGCQAASGVQFGLGFSTYFFQLAGFPTQRTLDLALGSLAVGFVGCAVGLITINRIGRRNLFIMGMAGCTIVNLVIGICAVVPSSGGALWTQAAMTIIFMFVYQNGVGPIGYALTAEIPSAKLRAHMVGWGVLWNALTGGVSNVILPYLVNPDEADLEGKVGWIYGGLSGLATIYAFFYVPETGGRNIDEIDELFARRIPMRKFHKVELDTDRTAALESHM